MKINLSTKPEILTLPSTILVYVEKIGPFMQTAPQAWQELWKVIGPGTAEIRPKQMMGLSRIDPSKEGDEAMTYQAAVSVDQVPKSLPKPLISRNFISATFAKFLLTGSYAQLAHAYPQAIERTEAAGHKMRPGFFIEIYLNTPDKTAEKDLLTEIYVPVSLQ
ncbi:MAG TPA: GyrI-like domain-containing protein [Bdellovibrionota bacterium]|jgi:DNA gyrase inhibitor GyrI|nr:GyrI-like domain-containing protein [Bdellovibrionota bacterium]